jgi:hypothetical protein
MVSIRDTATVTSIDEARNLKNPEILIYPNPAQDAIFIDLSKVADRVPEFSIMDCTGNTIKIIPLISVAGNNVFQVETGYLTPGYYFLRVFLSSGLSYTSHFVKL